MIAESTSTECGTVFETEDRARARIITATGAPLRKSLPCIVAAIVWCSPFGAAAEQPACERVDGRTFTVAVGGGRVRAALVEMRGRTHSGRNWVIKGEKLPSVAAVARDDGMEFSVEGKAPTRQAVSIAEFRIHLSEMPDMSDSTGKRTLVNDGEWKTVADIHAGREPFPGAWLWLTTCLCEEAAGSTIQGGALTRMEVWSGFTSARMGDFATDKNAYRMLKYGILLRQDAKGTWLGIVSPDTLAIGYEGADVLTICVARKGLAQGTPRDIGFRLCIGQGDAQRVAETWASRYARKPLRVAFCGDSVGAARGSYAAILATRIRKLAQDKARCLNLSRGGWTTESFRNVWSSRVLSREPNLVLIQLCYNDVGKIKPERVQENLRFMLDSILKQPDGHVLVLTPLSYDLKRVESMKARGTDIDHLHRDVYIPALQNVVKEYEAKPRNRGRLAFVNIWQAMTEVRAQKGADYVLLPDGSHPRAEGQRLIADTAWPVLKGYAANILVAPGNEENARDKR